VKVLLVGSGGREHALAWKLAQSPQLTRLYCAPGNAGIAQQAECVPIPATDFAGLARFARDTGIDFAVIAADAQLVGGLWDVLEKAGVPALGPSKAAAILEGSKGFIKDLCIQAGIPTARYGRFTEPASAMRYAETLLSGSRGRPVVVKADGLAAGKGVLIASGRAEAGKAIAFMFEGGFGESGREIVVEEFMEGEEASFFALSDGTNVIALAGAQDHKRVGDGDVGPNTGGMGAYSPAPVLPPALEQVAMEKFIRPTVAAFAAAGRPYMGVLYLGLMITREGPKLVEYNCRFGDPECQVLMPRLESDLLELLLAARGGMLDKVAVRWRPQAALTVVMASKGYPGPYSKGQTIAGLDKAAALPGVTLFHAGTQRHGSDIVAAGGRVLNVTATGATIAEAQARAYRAVDLIHWPDAFCRRDIGWRGI
jgi:phosphoribosylamine--glycine ligase